MPASLNRSQSPRNRLGSCEGMRHLSPIRARPNAICLEALPSPAGSCPRKPRLQQKRCPSSREVFRKRIEAGPLTRRTGMLPPRAGPPLTALPSRAGAVRGNEARRDRAGRHLGLGLCRLARTLLSAGPAPFGRARLRQPRSGHDRDQRNPLFASAARLFRTLARRDPGWLCLRRQGESVHHAPKAAARHRDGARQFFCLGRVAARREAGPVSVAVLSAFPL